ncbi:hypothetical protein DPMN_053422 [Dreissena polymorpha]|uniref:Uncharacterized protein n=1 Tax=Dreissena polymorpha TaxID=45954 RepID=A0A9D4CMR0_DREPO|nr:hypothetical protein DPMN_053422 [Dreissena polymorpha]
MSDVRYEVWLSTIGKKNIRNMPKLQALPPTTESLLENVKRAHLQTCIWKATLEQDPPTFNVTEYGWKKKEVGKVLSPVLFADEKPLAPASKCVETSIVCLFI